MRRTLSTISTLAVLSFCAVPVAAQDITFTKRTTTRMGGALGDLMNLVPGAGGEEEETVMISVSNKSMRTDRNDRTTLMNYVSGDVTSIDHDEQTWMQMNLGQMMGAFGGANASGQMPPGYTPPDQSGDAQVEYETSMSVERTGEFKDILGYRAEQVILRVDVIPTRAPEGQSLEDMPTHVMVTSMWVAEDFPGNVAMRELAAEFGEQFMGENREGMTQAFAQSSALRQAFEQNSEELAKLGDMPLEQTMAFSMLTRGAEFDMNEALNGEVSSGGGISVADIARRGLEDVARGRLGGLMGRRGRQPEPEPEPEEMAQQVTMVRVFESLVAFDQGPLERGWDAIPEGYEERASPFQRRN